jgi:sulfate transport system substrate-binding protein
MKSINAILLFVCMFIFFPGCSKGPDMNDKQVKLTLGAYTVPKEAYQKEIIPSFKEYWKKKTGQIVEFEESYEASGAQSRTIRAGFEADIAALSLEGDVEDLKKAGLITHDWKIATGKGFVTRSVVAIVYRPGNPKNIHDFEDLTRNDISVIYPSPKTSGGAMWVINAIYGAGLKTSEVKTGTQDETVARDLLKSVQRRVRIMDKSGRLSVTTFENGIGDALVTYENEALLRQKMGKDFPFAIPRATLLIENPVALLDKNVDKHKNREVAEAFIKFLYTKEAQRSFARYGFRPVDEDVLQEFKATYPVPEYLFTVDYLGGWESIQKKLYDKSGIWSKIVEELGNER